MACLRGARRTGAEQQHVVPLADRPTVSKNQPIHPPLAGSKRRVAAAANAAYDSENSDNSDGSLGHEDTRAAAKTMSGADNVRKSIGHLLALGQFIAASNNDQRLASRSAHN